MLDVFLVFLLRSLEFSGCAFAVSESDEINIAFIHIHPSFHRTDDTDASFGVLEKHDFYDLARAFLSRI